MSHSRNAHTLGIALVATGALCWSTAGLVVRHLDLDPWQIMFWRSLFLMLGMAPVLAMRRKSVIQACRSAILPMLASGFLLAGCFIFFILALSATSVANTLFVMACSPLLAAVIGRVFFGERIGTRTWIAIAAAGLGVAITVWGSLQLGDFAGASFAFLVALCFSINANLVRHRRGHSMLPGVFLAGLISAVIAAPIALPSAPAPPDLWLLAYLGIVQLGMGLVLFTIGVRFVPAAQAVVIGLLEIVLGPLWVWLGHGEQPTAMALLGGGIVITAVATDAFLSVRNNR